jgi:hypothetical protein
MYFSMCVWMVTWECDSLCLQHVLHMYSSNLIVCFIEVVITIYTASRAPTMVLNPETLKCVYEEQLNLDAWFLKLDSATS